MIFVEGEFNSYISDEELTSVFPLDSFSAYIKKYPNILYYQ